MAPAQLRMGVGGLARTALSSRTIRLTWAGPSYCSVCRRLWLLTGVTCWEREASDGSTTVRGIHSTSSGTERHAVSDLSRGQDVVAPARDLYDHHNQPPKMR